MRQHIAHVLYNSGVEKTYKTPIEADVFDFSHEAVEDGLAQVRALYAKLRAGDTSALRLTFGNTTINGAQVAALSISYEKE